MHITIHILLVLVYIIFETAYMQAQTHMFTTHTCTHNDIYVHTCACTFVSTQHAYVHVHICTQTT